MTFTGIVSDRSDFVKPTHPRAPIRTPYITKSYQKHTKLDEISYITHDSRRNPLHLVEKRAMIMQYQRNLDELCTTTTISTMNTPTMRRISTSIRRILMRTMHEMRRITNHLHTGTMHDIIKHTSHRNHASTEAPCTYHT